MSTVAIQSPGDMGAGVGADLSKRGFTVTTCMQGRSERSRTLAEQAGMVMVDTYEALVNDADLVLSIAPPSSAEALAQTICQAMTSSGRFPPYADCNAISPTTVGRIHQCVRDTGAVFIDAGIIGLAPGKSDLATRFYCSGPDTRALETIAGPDLVVRSLGSEIGQASAMKMIYASVTKGTNALRAAALTAAAKHGLSDAYHKELAESQAGVWQGMNRMVPRLPLDAGRWVGEMEEIAQFYESSGLPGGFHQAAAAIFELLDQTPIASETRETVDTSRTLAQALAMFVEALDDRR